VKNPALQVGFYWSLHSQETESYRPIVPMFFPIYNSVKRAFKFWQPSRLSAASNLKKGRVLGVSWEQRIFNSLSTISGGKYSFLGS
jgi:hypothetical protein